MHLRLSFSLDLGPTDEGGSVFMSDWALKAVKRLKSQQQDQRIQDEVFLEKQRIKRVYGLPLWLKVRENVRLNCSDFNREAGKEIMMFDNSAPSTELTVRATINGKHRSTHASFDESLGELSCCSGSNIGHWSLRATEDGQAQFFGSRGSSTPDLIAEQIMGPLI